MNEFKLNCAGRGLCAKGCGRQDKQLNTYDWLADVPGNIESTDLVEVQFKNTRKGYYHNSNHLPLEKGDVVAVESSPGHDIGVVTLTGRLVILQVKKANLKSDAEIKRVYRKVKPVDIEKYEEAKAKEHDTMIRARQIAKDLKLDMKIGDVEYQGDGNKAIFYYIADGRVDFRQLIKVLADAFRVRIEMRQIGARQEAGRIGGIGPCGRELCCATWMKNFVSVSTSAARLQDISLNPQKLAGQCAKLKCCMNYEADVYLEASKRLPNRELVLSTKDSDYYFFKADILANTVTYSTDKRIAANLVTLPAKRVFDVMHMNRRGEKPETLLEEVVKEESRPIDLVEQESLTRFDKRKKKKKKRPNSEGNREPQGGGSQQEAKGGAPAKGNETRGNGGPRNNEPKSGAPVRGNEAKNGGSGRGNDAKGGAPRTNEDKPRNGESRGRQGGNKGQVRDGEGRERQAGGNEQPRDGEGRERQGGNRPPRGNRDRRNRPPRPQGEGGERKERPARPENREEKS